MRKLSFPVASITAFVFVAAALVVSLRVLQGGPKPAAAPVTSSAPASNTDRLIVHEWGTFTNFAGSDGISLEFRPLVDQGLPDFVFDREQQAASPFAKFQVRAHVRMETPVTYFYTDRPRDVEAKVEFPTGLLTEFYPPVKSFGPEFQYNVRPPLSNSFLDWGRVHLIPPAIFALPMVSVAGQPPVKHELPKVSGDDHYGFARDTDSVIVQTSDQYFSQHFEKFLFYRGLGNFPLPTIVEALGGDRFSAKNFGKEPIRGMLLAQITGGRARFVEIASLPAGSASYLELPALEFSVSELADRLERMLVGTGLYEKEARAMVNTWRSSWFGEDGTRVLYLLPQSTTNTLLPLTISPAPSELIRVLVGRIELMTPERETQLKAAIQGAGTCLNAANESVRTELRTLGRFAEPALERLARETDDESLRGSATTLLAEVRRLRAGQ